jgi:Pre-PUA-like domain
MFKKAPSVKSLSVLRSSDRKKIIQEITRLYAVEGSDSAEVRNTLLPEGAQVGTSSSREVTDRV